jgi:hypothetical protein
LKTRGQLEHALVRVRLNEELNMLGEVREKIVVSGNRHELGGRAESQGGRTRPSLEHFCNGGACTDLLVLMARSTKQRPTAISTIVREGARRRLRSLVAAVSVLPLNGQHLFHLKLTLRHARYRRLQLGRGVVRSLHWSSCSPTAGRLLILSSSSYACGPCFIPCSDDDTDLPLPTLSNHSTNDTPASRRPTSSSSSRAPAAAASGTGGAAGNNPMAGLEAMMQAMGGGGMMNDPRSRLPSDAMEVQDDTPYKQSVASSPSLPPFRPACPLPSFYPFVAFKRVLFADACAVLLHRLAGIPSTPSTSTQNEHTAPREVVESRASSLTGGLSRGISLRLSSPSRCPSSTRSVLCFPPLCSFADV